MVHMKKHEWMTGPTFSVDDVIDPALSGGDSPSASSTATKRKRASRPKVRTGCITCTGRKCDGYGGTAPPRPKKSPSAPSSSLQATVTDPLAPNYAATMPSDPYLAKRHELARHSFAAACRGNSALRILRPLAADIEGTEQERQYFHRFRRAAEAGLAMHASSLGAGFWRRLVPLVGQSDPAVRHALIALGAAHESAQLQQERARTHPMTATSSSTTTITRSKSPEQQQQRQRYQQQQQKSSYISTPPPEDNSACIDQLELFMIQQYNLSIYHLQQHVQPGSPPESVEITLICCLVFVCIETSRGNEAAALAHVANGLQIIKALPPDSELVHFPPDSRGDRNRFGGGGSSSSTSTSGSSPRISRSDWRQLLDFFLALEPSAATYGFTSSQPPTPPCPTMSTWETPLECFDEMLPQWEIEGADVEI
ncbi:hypothetical protein F4805DRAFT_453471 [Annulohypoxylon moriforme]|nr:hypothetical protein F4805DRAFT_453471 [Annulohypoxylon moriforme]